MGPVWPIVVGGRLAQRILGSFPARGWRHKGRRRKAVSGGDVESGRDAVWGQVAAWL